VKLRLNEQGFTLVELIVVTMLLGMLSAVLFGTINGILQSKRLVEEQSQFDRGAQYALGRIIDELSTRFPSPIVLNSDQEEDEEGGGSSLQSASTALQKQYMLGINKKDRDRQFDSLSFVSAKGGQAFYGAHENHGLVTITYVLKESKDTEDGKKSQLSDPTSFVLVREETPSVDNKETIEKQKIIFPLVRNVWSLNFRYLSDEEWLTSWGKGKVGFPAAIEITLVIGSDEKNLQKYRTAVAVDFPSPATRSNSPMRVAN